MKRLPALPADVVDVVSAGGVAVDAKWVGAGVVVDSPDDADEGRFDLRLVSLSRLRQSRVKNPCIQSIKG